MTTVRDAFTYLTEKIEPPAHDRALRTISVNTAWPITGLSIDEIGFLLDPCGGQQCLVRFVNPSRQLLIVRYPHPAAQLAFTDAPILIDELRTDIAQALAIAGDRGGTAMLNATPSETQVTLFLSQRRRARLGGAIRRPSIPRPRLLT